MRSASRVVDLFKAWDDDRSGTVDKKEFFKAVRSLGFDVSQEDTDAVFDSLDDVRQPIGEEAASAPLAGHEAVLVGVVAVLDVLGAVSWIASHHRGSPQFHSPFQGWHITVAFRDEIVSTSDVIRQLCPAALVAFEPTQLISSNAAVRIAPADIPRLEQPAGASLLYFAA